jgi:hypothetical protein
MLADISNSTIEIILLACILALLCLGAYHRRL